MLQLQHRIVQIIPKTEHIIREQTVYITKSKYLQIFAIIANIYNYYSIIFSNLL